MGKNITRRAALFGALVSSAALAVPAIAAVQAKSVPALAIPIKETLRTLTPEQEAVLTAWNAAEDIYAAADAKYHAWCCSLPRGMSSSTAPDQTIRAAWIDADTEKWQARHAMMRLFRKPSTT